MAGSVVHVELPSSDANRAAAFWNGLFGWGLGASAMEAFDYRMAQIAPGQGVAVFPSPDAAGTGPIVYFSTDDIEASGMQNTVTYKSGSPQINKSGLDNSVDEG